MQVFNAHQNNLKNVNLDIPENQLIVVTGLSGSGKSSLAMGVIANEGYRYFLESLPDYQQNARVIPTAEVDQLTNLPPVVKVDQTKRFQSTHATFGTLSDLTSIFRILFARYSASESMSKSLFSFNNPKGACPVCRGIGEAEYIDVEKLIGDEDKTLREGAITTTLPTGYIVYSQVTVEELNKICIAHGFTVDVPWKDLTNEQRDVILNGSEAVKVFYGKHSLESRMRWDGIKAKPREEGYYKGILPIMSDILKRDRNPNILKFASAKECPSCGGARIKREHLHYKWHGFNFHEWMTKSLQSLSSTLNGLTLESGEKILVDQLQTSLNDLIQLGMGHYSLHTPSVEITSGDAQRIKLIKQLNANLQGILYVFDEPSIGLPEAYQQHLRHIFQRLIEAGNTVMVVEHDLKFIQSADWIIELGPKAGLRGGEIIFNGPLKEFLNSQIANSPTLSVLNNQAEHIKLTPTAEDEWEPKESSLSCISRKSKEIEKKLHSFCKRNALKKQLVTDQAIGKTPRSNPATYTGLADKFRDLFAKTDEAKTLKLTKSHFSFNNKIGRCPECEGAGVITLSMSVLGEVNQECPSCNGKRFKTEVLQAKWNEKSIADIYNLSINQAIDFFQNEEKIFNILILMERLGLGYIKLGQPSNTLSGGEAQRIKLTKHFTKSSRNTLLILEEPSIGLHHQNVNQLISALQALKKQTAGIVCFENHDLFQRLSDYWINNATESMPWQKAPTTKKSLNNISIEGANTHNLKDVSLKIPKNKLTVVTGFSGSGKSSLIIDTLHGYGLTEMTKQFSAYQQSRVGVNFQFDVKQIDGLTPTICISRKEKNYTDKSDIANQSGMDKVLRFAFSRKAQFEGYELSASHFSTNHELGRCHLCEGYGEELQPDLDKMLLDASLSIEEGVFLQNKAMAYYGQPSGQYMSVLKEVGKHYGFSLDTPFIDYTEEERKIILHGAGEREWEATWEFKTKTRKGSQQVKMPWKGLFHYLLDEYYRTRKNKNIKDLKALFKPVKCRNCEGSGLRPERLQFKVGEYSIHELRSMSFAQFKSWLLLTDTVHEVDIKLKNKIKEQLMLTLEKAEQLHIDHLQLNRKSKTLSGGENQRVTLIKQLNSPLTGVTYLLDEPSAGLSQQNTKDLINLLQDLVGKGNTVIVIEHNKEIMLSADHLIEVGPGAGNAGGEIIYSGDVDNFIKTSDHHHFLNSPKSGIILRAGSSHITFKNISRYSLSKSYFSLPVGGLTAISGKSGIGKTTLVKEVLIPSIQYSKPVHCDAIIYPKKITEAFYFEPHKLRVYSNTLLIDYLNLLKPIGRIFSAESTLKPADFSYKSKNAQCPNCKGKGYIETSLDVAANAIETCERCGGTRYRKKILTETVRGKSIADILNFTIGELQNWIKSISRSDSVKDKLGDFVEIGLEHLTLGQKVESLSSGEKQRLLLLQWLKDPKSDALYILDEPSIGLHYADIDLLLAILKKLSQKNDVLVIDHNPYLLNEIGTGVILE